MWPLEPAREVCRKLKPVFHELEPCWLLIKPQILQVPSPPAIPWRVRGSTTSTRTSVQRCDRFILLFQAPAESHPRHSQLPPLTLACCRMAWACASWADTRGPLEPASPPPLKRNWWEKTDKAGQGLLSLQLCSVPKSIPVPPAHPINPRVTQLRATQASGSPARRALPARGGTQ